MWRENWRTDSDVGLGFALGLGRSNAGVHDDIMMNPTTL